MDINILSDLFSIGLHPIPLVWCEKTKTALVYPEHRNGATGKDGKHTIEDAKKWFNEMKEANGIGLKLHPPFFMFDFDLKNTENKNLYYTWLNAVSNISEDALKKMTIEKTRSGGYHVYGKFEGVTHKVTLAKSNSGAETISIYTGGLLSFAYPTPGYDLIQNDFSDLEALTQDEFDTMVMEAVKLNEYIPKEGEYIPGEKIEYPPEYESMAVQFDLNCPDDLWENLLNSISLYPVSGKKQQKFGKEFYYYKREGSIAKSSAKVRFDRKRLFIFSGSIVGFPNWHTKINEQDNSWHITPTKLIHFREGKNWVKTISIIKQYVQEFSITFIESKPISEQSLVKDRTSFPYDIFPENVQTFIKYQRIQHEYLAGGVLGAISSVIGNSCWLEAMHGYIVKPILYLGIVAPPGASKSPALTKAFRPLEDIDKEYYATYAQALQEYNDQISDYEKDKKNNQKPELPAMQQILIKDSTIEMMVNILGHNQNGCCILADELIGFLNRMNQYKNGDELQKWLENWSGHSILLQRVTRGTTKIENPFCSIVGGIQDGVLEMMSRDENQHNGFYHRFLFVYPDPQDKIPWQQLDVPWHIESGYKMIFYKLNGLRGNQIIYKLSSEANTLYKTWFDNKNKYYNKATSDNIKGIIAKYQDYCLRFSLIIQVVNELPERSGFVCESSMEKAIRLTEYFLGNMHKALRILTPESPLDRLNAQWRGLYEAIPVEFSTKELTIIAETKGIKSTSAKTFLMRNAGKLFKQVDRGTWEKIY